MNNQAQLKQKKQIIDDQISEIEKSMKITKDVAFLRYVYSVLFNTEFNDTDFEADLVDGSDDRQFDIIHIEANDRQATVHLVQVKSSSFRSTIIVQMRDGLDWIFKHPEEKYKTLTNEDLVLKIGDIRDLIERAFGKKNLNIKVYYVANSIEEPSAYYEKEVADTRSKFKNEEFQEFEFYTLGPNELIEEENKNKKEKDKIRNKKLPIEYDANNKSVIRFQSKGVRAAICTVKGIHLAELVKKHIDVIFEENVRTFLGVNRKVNKEILKTSQDDTQSGYFWFYNNGITITCDSFEIQESVPCVQLDGIQIVNGGQTSLTLVEALNEGKLQDDVSLLVKIYETQDRKIVDKITLTTNNQNAVSSRDLRSNDTLQSTLSTLFKNRNYHYEKKPREFKDLSRQEKQKVISNEKVGQAYLSVVEKKPAIAMAQKSKIWLDFYEDIFSSEVEILLAAYLLYQQCYQMNKQLQKDASITGIESAIAKYGHFHVARLVGYYELGNWKNCGPSKLENFINQIEQDPDSLEASYDQAIQELKPIVRGLSDKDLSRVMNTFKSSTIEKKLDDLTSK